MGNTSSSKASFASGQQHYHKHGSVSCTKKHGFKRHGKTRRIRRHQGGIGSSPLNPANKTVRTNTTTRKRKTEQPLRTSVLINEAFKKGLQPGQ